MTRLDPPLAVCPGTTPSSAPGPRPCRCSSPARCRSGATARSRRSTCPTAPGRGAHHPGPALAVHRPPRRQPGADRPDDPGPQAQDVRAAGGDGLQGDRGRLPLGQPDRLRLRPPADRAGQGPRRRDDLGADPGPGGPDRADRRVAGGCQDGNHPPLQRDRAAVPAGGVQGGPGRVRRPRHPRHRAGDEVRRAAPGRRRVRLPVLPGDLHRHRAGVRRRGLQRGDGRLAARRRPRDHPEPARHGRDGHAERVRRPDRVVRPERAPPRARRDLAAPAQRPRHGRRRRPSWP